MDRPGRGRRDAPRCHCMWLRRRRQPDKDRHVDDHNDAHHELDHCHHVPECGSGRGHRRRWIGSRRTDRQRRPRRWRRQHPRWTDRQRRTGRRRGFDPGWTDRRRRARWRRRQHSRRPVRWRRSRWRRWLRAGCRLRVGSLTRLQRRRRSARQQAEPIPGGWVRPRRAINWAHGRGGVPPRPSRPAVGSPTARTGHSGRSVRRKRRPLPARAGWR